MFLKKKKFYYLIALKDEKKPASLYIRYKHIIYRWRLLRGRNNEENVFLKTFFLRKYDAEYRALTIDIIFFFKFIKIRLCNSNSL